MVFGLAFTALLLLLSFILSNPDHLVRTSFPADSQGKVCGFDLPQYPYIYFTDLPDVVPSKKDRKIESAFLSAL